MMGRHAVRQSERPLVVTADESLLDELLGLAASAGIDVEVVPDAGSARRRWATASVIVLDDAIVESVVSLATPRRDGVIVLGRDLDDADIWRRAVNVGADHVVFLPDAASWLVDQLASPAVSASPARVVTVLTASGGVGASTLAASLSMRAVMRELSPILVDADPLGGGIDLLLGAEDTPGVRWGELGATSGRIERRSLVDALPAEWGLPFLSWSRSGAGDLTSAAYDSVLSALIRDGSLVVVDLGRAVGPLSDLVLAVTTTAVLLVPARVRAVAAAAHLINRLDHLRDQLCLVVRRPAPAGLDVATIARTLELPLLGSLPHDGRRAEWEENGLPPSTKGSWQRVGDAILDRESQRTSAA